MNKVLTTALLGFALATTSAMAADIRITDITAEHPHPDFNNTTLITLTFSNGRTEDYLFMSNTRDDTPEQAANRVVNDKRVRSWHVGDIVEFRISEECFMGDLITNLSKDPPSVVCFQ